MKDLDIDENYVKNLAEKVEGALKVVETLIADGVATAVPVVSSEAGTAIGAGIKVAGTTVAAVGSKVVGGTIMALPVPQTQEIS